MTNQILTKKSRKFKDETKYQLLINKWGNKGLKHLNDSKAFIEYSNGMNNSYKILKNKIQIRNEKMIVVDDMIDNMFSNKEIIQ